MIEGEGMEYWGYTYPWLEFDNVSYKKATRKQSSNLYRIFIDYLIKDEPYDLISTVEKVREINKLVYMLSCHFLLRHACETPYLETVAHLKRNAQFKVKLL